jgi:hypothetical protein
MNQRKFLCQGGQIKALFAMKLRQDDNIARKIAKGPFCDRIGPVFIDFLSSSAWANGHCRGIT